MPAIVRYVFLTLVAVNAVSFGVGAYWRFPSAGESRALAAAVSHWTTGDFGLGDDRPPLARMIAALPVLPLQPTMSEPQKREQCHNPAIWSQLEDRYARDLAASMLPDAYLDMVRLARLAGLSWWLLGAWLVFRWAGELFGGAASWWALALWSAAPHVMAAEVAIDSALPAAVAAALATYAFVTYLRRPDFAKALMVGLLLGVALLVDRLAIGLIAVWGVAWAVARIWGGGGRARDACTAHASRRLEPTPLCPPFVRGEHPVRAAHLLGRAVTIGVACLWVVNLGHGMQANWQRLEDYEFVGRALAGPLSKDWSGQGPNASGNRFRGRWAGKLIVPVPVDYLRGLDRELWRTEMDGPGREIPGRRGVRATAVALALRVPLGIGAMVLWAVALGVLRGDREASPVGQLLIWAPVGLVLAAMVVDARLVPIDRGPVLAAPFAIVGVSRLAGFIAPWRRAGFAAVLLTAETVIGGTVGGWGGRPYWNEAALAMDRLQAQLADGPGDGGPDLLALKDWADAHPEARPLGTAVRHVVNLKPFGLSEDLPPSGPREIADSRIQDSRFKIADSRVQGSRPSDLTLGPLKRDRRIGPCPGHYALDIDGLRSPAFSYFQSFRPMARVGSAILVYDLTGEDVGPVRRRLGLPALDAPAAPPIAGRGFLRRDYRDGSGDDSHYAVFVPCSYTDKRSWPLVLFLHGAGDAGRDGDQYLKVGLPPAIEAREETFGLIAVVPQGRKGDWSPGSWDATRALAVLDRIEAEFRVDRKRIYLTGVSSGGAGVWALAMRCPERWAAIVPVSSGGCDPARAARIQDVPCWCFHNVNDIGSPPDAPRAMIAALRRAGGAPRYTELFYPGITSAERHNAWDAAYGNAALYEWLLTQHLP